MVEFGRLCSQARFDIAQILPVPPRLAYPWRP
jgi:hypothetical protein